jgi:ABC-2 type transport system ATP-binding protein
VLILDEPTTGLDPNQLVEIRKLIKQLGKEKTVILSTHIMQEVEAVCDQVVIINKGLIVANDETKNLQAAALQQVTYVVEFDQVIQKQALLKIDGVIAAQVLADKSWVLQTNTLVDVRKNIFDFAVKNNLVLLSIQKEEEKLEDIFRKLTEN